MTIRNLLETTHSKTLTLLRWVTGFVFLTEGLQKFIYPAMRGVGRFEKMGFPAPEFFGPFVGALEVGAGLFLILGFATKLAALTTFCIMAVALITTKFPILFAESFGPFNLRE